MMPSARRASARTAPKNIVGLTTPRNSIVSGAPTQNRPLTFRRMAAPAVASGTRSTLKAAFCLSATVRIVPSTAMVLHGGSRVTRAGSPTLPAATWTLIQPSLRRSALTGASYHSSIWSAGQCGCCRTSSKSESSRTMRPRAVTPLSLRTPIHRRNGPRVSLAKKRPEMFGSPPPMTARSHLQPLTADGMRPT